MKLPLFFLFFFLTVSVTAENIVNDASCTLYTDGGAYSTYVFTNINDGLTNTRWIAATYKGNCSTTKGIWVNWTCSSPKYIDKVQIYSKYEGGFPESFKYFLDDVQYAVDIPHWTLAFGYHEIDIDDTISSFALYLEETWQQNNDGNCLGAGMEISELLIHDDPNYLDEYPSVSINDQKSVYCYNDSQSLMTYDFYLNATDSEGDSISYFAFWNDDFQSMTLIDDFSDTSYNMQTEGWAFQSAGCNYSTSTGALNLYSGCDSIGMVKWLDDASLNTSLNVYFDAWVFHNTSNDYCIMNGYNEKLMCLRMASYYDGVYNDLYTNFSYWNGTDFIDFDSSFYTDVFSVDFDINSTTGTICISGIDEPVYNDCNMQITEELHGTTDNIPAKFYMWPFYDFGWTQYQTPYVFLDNLQYREKDYIPWYSYEAGDKVTHLFESEGQEYLTIYVTDNVHTPEYKTFQFPILVMGNCDIESQFNKTESTSETITENTRDYVKAVPNGEALFNKGFFFMLLLIWGFILIKSGSLPLACIGTGVIGLFGSWLLTGDLTQMISSASLIGLGVTILVISGF